MARASRPAADDGAGDAGIGRATAYSYSTDVPAAERRRPRARVERALRRRHGDHGAPLGDAGHQLLGCGDRDRQRRAVDADLAAQRQRRPGAPGRLCINIYSATLNGSNQASGSSLLGSYAYQLADWPESTEFISFPFRYLASGNTSSLAAGKRLMVELTADSAYSLGMALVYDHPNFPASIQLETQ